MPRRDISVEALRHKDKRRNIPTAELEPIMDEKDKAPELVPYPRNRDLVEATREAADARFDVVITCAFNFDAHSAELDRPSPNPEGADEPGPAHDRRAEEHRCR
jgi:hypothetical protein